MCTACFASLAAMDTYPPFLVHMSQPSGDCCRSGVGAQKIFEEERVKKIMSGATNLGEDIDDDDDVSDEADVDEYLLQGRPKPKDLWRHEFLRQLRAYEEQATAAKAAAMEKKVAFHSLV